MNHQDFLTPIQLSRKYPVSRATIYSACDAGLIACYRVPSRRGTRGKLLIKEPDFLTWLEAHRSEAEGPKAGPPPKRATPPLRHLKLS